MRLPRLLYEVLPALYLLTGIFALFFGELSIIGRVSGLMLALAAGQIHSMRRHYRIRNGDSEPIL